MPSEFHDALLQFAADPWSPTIASFEPSTCTVAISVLQTKANLSEKRLRGVFGRQTTPGVLPLRIAPGLGGPACLHGCAASFPAGDSYRTAMQFDDCFHDRQP